MGADDESIHPSGREWDEYESILDETEYDSKLGLEMAQDAMAVSRGELSEAEFHEKYHEDVMAEFGVDDRPTQEALETAQEHAQGTMSRMLEKFEGDGDESRRDAMKKMGAGAAAVGLGTWATVDDGQEPALAAVDDHADAQEDEGVQWGKVIDLERCDACLSCVVACDQENNTDQGINWMYVIEYEDGGPDTSRNRLVRSCQHCTEAPCEKVCPTTARHTRDSDGLVLTDYDVCIGCRYCQVACPYGLNYFQWDEPETSQEELEAMYENMEGDHQHDDRGRWVANRAPMGVMSKCTFNVHRQDGHKGEEKIGTTACQEACPPGAIRFGDRNDPNSDPQQYLDNPSKARALNMIAPPSSDDLATELEGADEDLDAVLEAAQDLDEEMLAIFKAIEIVSDGVVEPEIGNSEIAGLERKVRDVLDVLENHGLDLESEDVLVELGLADESAEGEEFAGPNVGDAQALLDGFAGVADSNFKLLEDVGTSPNTTFLGNEPGPHAEQVPGPVAYEDVGQTDSRKDVTDDKTIGDAGVSL